MAIDQTITQKLEALDTAIQEIECDREQAEPIRDGIIDPERYFSAKYRILWILKEPYDRVDDEGNPCGGGWDLKDVINKKNTARDLQQGGKNTYTRMTYVSFSVLNGLRNWNDMELIEDDPSMLDALKSIAYINVKKLPGHTTSNETIIAAAYKTNSQLLLRQIDAFIPDVIIGGGTLHHFVADLKLSGLEKCQIGSLSYYSNNNKLYIQAPHPAVRGGTPEYCDDIIAAVKWWLQNKNASNPL